MAANIDIILKASDKYSREFANLNGEINKIQKSSGVLSSAFAGTAKAVAGVTVAVAGIGAGATAGIFSAAKAAGEIEQVVANTAAVLQKSVEEVQPLNTLISELAINPNLKVDAVQAADAINMLARNGLNLEEIMGGAAEATVLLANATGGDFGQAADIATDSMSLFGISAENMLDSVNGITSVVNNSKFSINDYALALAQGGAVASASGVDYDDFNAAIASVAAGFASGSDAGTSFKTFLQRIIPTTNASADAMRKLGLFTGLSQDEFDDQAGAINNVQNQIATLDPTTKNYSEKVLKLNSELASLQKELVAGNSVFFDANGNMEEMSVIAGELNRAMAGLSDEQRNLALQTIFGADASRFAAEIAKYSTSEFKAFQTQLGKTDAVDSAAVRMQTFSGSLEVLQGVVESIKLSIGNEFLPLFTSLANQSTEFLTANAPQIIAFSDKMASSLETRIPQFIAGLTEFYSNAVLYKDKILLVINEIGPSIEAVSAAWADGSLFSKAFSKLKTGVVMGMSFVFDNVNFVGIFSKLKSNIFLAFQSIDYAGLGTNLVARMRAMWAGVDLGSTFGTLKTNLVTRMRAMWASVDLGSTFNTLKTNLVARMRAMWSSVDLGSTFTTLRTNLVTKMRAMWSSVDLGSTFITLRTNLVTKMRAMWAGVDFTSTFGTLKARFTEQMSSLFSQIDLGASIGALVGYIKAKFSELDLSSVLGGISFVDLFFQLADSVRAGARALFDGIGTALSSGFLSVSDELGTAAGTMAATAAKAIAGGVYFLGNALAGAIQGIMDGFDPGDLSAGIVRFVANFVNSFVSELTGINLQESITGVVSQISDFVENVRTAIDGLVATFNSEGLLGIVGIVSGLFGGGGLASAIPGLDTIQALIDWTWPDIPGLETIQSLIAWVWPSWGDIATIASLLSWAWPTIPGISTLSSLISWKWPSIPGLDTIKSLLNFKWPAFPTLPSFPSFGGNALGGDVRSTGVSRFNEFGQEAVVRRGRVFYPQGDYAFLQRGDQVINNRQLEAGGMGGGAVTINMYNTISNNMDINTVARKVAEVIKGRA